MSFFITDNVYDEEKNVICLFWIHIAAAEIVKCDLIGSDESGLINVIQSCYKTCELLFPDTYVVGGKRSIIHDIAEGGLHTELSIGSKFLLMREADANLTKLEFYHQAGTVF